MKVYSVIPDVAKYRTLLPTDEAIWQTDMMFFDCVKKGHAWPPPQLYSFNPKQLRGDFVKIGPGCLVAEPTALPVVQEFFGMAGELLPIPFEGRTLTLLNVIECVNALDEDKSDWLLTPGGERAALKRYTFHPNRFVESTVFKIPFTSKAEVLVVERDGDPECEFKAAVEKAGLTGLLFKEIWRDDIL